MSQLSSFINDRGISFIEPNNPTTSVVGAKATDAFCNSVTGEIFQCTSSDYADILRTTNTNLVAMYTMDDGTLTDVTGNYTATLGASVTSTTGVIGGGLDFPGGVAADTASAEYVGAIAELGSGHTKISMTFWAKFDSSSNTDTGPVNLGQSGGDVINLVGDSAANSLKFVCYDPGVNRNMTRKYLSVVTPGTWQHFSLVWDGTAQTQNLYINGTLVSPNSNDGSGAGGEIPFVTSGVTSGINFGKAYTWPLSTRWDGKLDQVRVFDKALTQEEITEIYNEPTAVKSQEWKGSQGTVVPKHITSQTHPDLVAMYTMDSIVGTTLIDETGNCNGTLVNSPVSISGKIDQAIETNGTSNYIAVSGTTNITALSVGAVCAWVNFKNADVNSILFLSGGLGSPTEFNIELHPGGFPRIGITNESNQTVYQGTGNAAIPVDTWGFVVFQSAGSSYKMFLNGVETAVSTTSGTNNGNWFSSRVLSKVNIGYREYNGPAKYRVSRVDQLRVFNRALTQEEITALYNEGL